MAVVVVAGAVTAVTGVVSSTAWWCTRVRHVSRDGRRNGLVIIADAVLESAEIVSGVVAEAISIVVSFPLFVLLLLLLLLLVRVWMMI